MGDCACHAGDLDLCRGGEELVFAFLELTPDCNNRCAGCSNVFAAHRAAPPLTFDAWVEIVEALRPHVRWLKLTGGEPTLYPDFDALIAYLDQRGLPFRLLTNGCWTDRERTLALLVGSSVVESLLISLHGPDAASHEAFTRVPGSFARAVETIRRAAAAGLRVATSTVITAHNWDRVEELTAFALSLGACHAVFNRYIGAPLPGLEAAPQLSLQALQVIVDLSAAGHPVRLGTPVPHCLVPNNDSPCLAGRAFVTVDPWGNVRPCNHTPLHLGNLLHDPLEGLLSSERLSSWLEVLPALCDGCTLQAACRGGCRAESTLRDLPFSEVPSVALAPST